MENRLEPSSISSTSAVSAKNSSLDETNETSSSGLLFEVSLLSSHLYGVTIDVFPDVSKTVHNQTIELFKRKKLDGLARRDVPSAYIEENFKNALSCKLKSYLFRHVVLDYLVDEVVARKIPMANDPRLKQTIVLNDYVVRYVFDISVAKPLELKEWKNFLFKPPKRKQYKDLDKQVTQFISQKAVSPKKQKMDLIEEEDWVCFSATLLDKNNMPLEKKLTSSFWIKVKNEEVINPLQDLFLGKKLNDILISNNLESDDQDGDFENYRYNFLIKVKAIVKGRVMSLDHLKTMFKLKNKSSIHTKLMEVFSYRNDQSQRKAIIEEMFHLFLTKHRFEVAKHLMLRRQETILQTLMQQPDYHVYKSQKDFQTNIELLAEKQLKEEIIIDQIAYKDNIKVDTKDMQNYLHLFNNNRLREFVYFRPTFDNFELVNVPINSGMLKQVALREKTLNYVLYMLMH